MQDSPTPQPWSTERSNIPWDDPGFGARMLVEHLSQAHDAASRRIEAIERQVTWLHDVLLGGTPTRVLDLGCGPGLYTERLARLGHTCHGIDINPASIAHARRTAKREGLACTYAQADLRTAPFGEGHGLVTLLYGELSVFSPDNLRSILTRAAAALRPGGRILLEPHTEHGVARIGDEPHTVQELPSGLFLDAPHRLESSGRFDVETGVATRHWVVRPLGGGPATEHFAWYQAYTDDALRALLGECGFDASRVEVTRHPTDDAESPVLQLVTAPRGG